MAEAILEVLEAEPVAVHAQQDVALGGRHAPDGLSRIVGPRSPLRRHRRDTLRGLRCQAMPCSVLIRPVTRSRDIPPTDLRCVSLTKKPSRSHHA